MNPMFATPCYGGSCFEPYVRSMVQLTNYLSKKDIPFRFVTLTNESLVTRARNKLLKVFLDSDCSHLFFIDADIEFAVADVLRLVESNQDVIVGAYPMKTVMLENLVGRSNLSLRDIELATAHYVVNIKFKDEEAKAIKSVELHNGLIELLDAGTGFMCIKREVVEKMIQAYPETEYYQTEGNNQQRFFALFDTMIDDGRYLSEDYTFCRRWQKIGGKIWMDPEVVLHHMGSYLYKGRKILKDSSR